MIIFQQDQNYIKEHANYETGVCYESQFNFYIKFDTTLLNVVSALDLYNTSETRLNQKSFGLNYQKTGKELMSQDEITVMDGSNVFFSFEVSDRSYQTNSISQSIRITSSWRTMIRRIYLILKTISKEKVKLNLIEIE